MPLILKYQELFIKLSVRIVISRTSARVSVRGIPEEKNIILADEPTMNLLFKHHAETTGHDIHPKYATILERRILNHERRVFLESWHSTLDKDTINERKEFPKNYTPLVKSHRLCIWTHPMDCGLWTVYKSHGLCINTT